MITIKGWITSLCNESVLLNPNASRLSFSSRVWTGVQTKLREMFDFSNRFRKQILFDFSKLKNIWVVISRITFTSNEGNNSETSCRNFQNWELFLIFKKETYEANCKPVVQHIILNANVFRICLWISFTSCNKQKSHYEIYYFMSFALTLLTMSEIIGRLINLFIFLQNTIFKTENNSAG